MFVFAIEACGRTVALLKENDRIMLDGFLSGDRDEGQHLRNELLLESMWDGISPFTARLATESEDLDYEIIHHIAEGEDAPDFESRWYLNCEQNGTS